MPRVSVIIPSYNSEATIGRAIRSVFAQTFTDYELILIDDASRDGTLTLIGEATAGKENVKVIALERNGGAAAARNAGIQAAAGELIAFLDSDDEWLPEKLERQVAALDAAPQAVVIGCNAEWLSSSGRFLYRMEDQPVETGAGAWKALLETGYLSTPCVVARKAAVEAERGFDEALPVGEDQDLWFRLAQRGEVLFLPEVLVRIHRQQGSLMAREAEGMADHWLPMVERHVERNADRLDAADRRAILGPKYSLVGRFFYLNAAPVAGLRLMSKAIRLGYQPLYHLLFMLVKAPRAVSAYWRRGRRQKCRA